MTVNALSPSSANVNVGGVWDIHVEVLDVDGCPVADDTPVITVTDPFGATSTPEVEVTAAGYRSLVIPALAGRYVARAVTASNGAADFTCYTAAVVAAGAMPTIADVSDYLDPHSYTSAELQGALDAESSAQRDVCRIPAAYPASLREALLRRVARNLSMRRLTLALARGDAEAGSSDIVLSGSDPEVRRLEGPYPKLVVG